MEMLAVEREAEFLELVSVEGLSEGFGLPLEGAHHLLSCVGGCSKGARPASGLSGETRERGRPESSHDSKIINEI